MRRTTPVTWDQARVGLFILIALGLLALGVFFIGQTGHVFGQRYELVTLVRSAAGLAPGAMVQVAGQSAGQVDRIEFIDPERRPATGEAVALRLSINRNVRHQIREDSRVRIRTQGLLGERLIDIDPGTADARVLGEGDTIQAAPSVSFNELFDEASMAVVQLTDLTERLSEITRRMLDGEGMLGRLMQDDALYDRLLELGGSLDAALSAAVEGDGALGQLLRDDRLYERLTSTMTSLDELTAEVAAGKGTLGRLARSDSLYDALSGLAVRSDSLLAGLQAGEGSMGRLLTDEALYEELLRSLVDLNATLEDLRQDPRRYVPPVRVF